MSRNRQNKIIMIAILCVVVIGLSVGFAAFQRNLTISSSAEVLPDSSDFSVKIYGINQDIPEGSNYEDYYENDIYYTSDTISRPLSADLDSSNPFVPIAENASIINSSDGMKISNLAVNFSEPGEMAMYYFVIRNEGEYDAYLKPDDFSKFPDAFEKTTCTAVGDATQSLVDAACDGMYINARFFDHNFEVVMNDIRDNGYYVIEPGSFAWFVVIMTYQSNATRADGDFNVVWEDIPLTFSTVS